MSVLGPRHWVFAVLLLALAGYVDALGYLQLGGFFVSFMSGNTTRFAVGLARNLPEAAIGACLIAAFVGGACGGALLRSRLGRKPTPILLLLVAMLLAAATGLGWAGQDWSSALSLAFAMGVENDLLLQKGAHPLGVTYVTGTLVHLGQGLARALSGGPPWSWRWPFVLWLGLVTGAVLGALSFPLLHVGALGAAAAAALILAAAAHAVDLE